MWFVWHNGSGAASRPHPALRILKRLNLFFHHVCALAVLIFMMGLTASAQSNVVTYHYDASRSGLNSNEVTLTPANVNSDPIRQAFFFPGGRANLRTTALRAELDHSRHRERTTSSLSSRKMTASMRLTPIRTRARMRVHFGRPACLTLRTEHRRDARPEHRYRGRLRPNYTDLRNYRHSYHRPFHANDVSSTQTPPRTGCRASHPRSRHYDRSREGARSNGGCSIGSRHR